MLLILSNNYNLRSGPGNRETIYRRTTRIIYVTGDWGHVLFRRRLDQTVALFGRRAKTDLILLLFVSRDDVPGTALFLRRFFDDSRARFNDFTTRLSFAHAAGRT